MKITYFYIFNGSSKWLYIYALRLYLDRDQMRAINLKSIYHKKFKKNRKDKEKLNEWNPQKVNNIDNLNCTGNEHKYINIKNIHNVLVYGRRLKWLHTPSTDLISMKMKIKNNIIYILHALLSIMIYMLCVCVHRKEIGAIYAFIDMNKSI